MSAEPPGGRAIKTCCGESIEAELFCASMDIIGNRLKRSEILDIGDLVTCGLKESLIYDDAECFIAITCCEQLTVFAVEVEIIGGHFLIEIGTGKIIAEFTPGLDCALVSALEEGGGIFLIHLCGKDFVVGSGCCGDNLNLDTGLLGIGLCKLLPCCICFGLEVQVIYAAFGLATAGKTDCHGEDKHDCQNKCKILFHCYISLFLFIFTHNAGKSFIDAAYRSADAQFCA